MSTKRTTETWLLLRYIFTWTNTDSVPRADLPSTKATLKISFWWVDRVVRWKRGQGTFTFNRRENFSRCSRRNHACWKSPPSTQLLKMQESSQIGILSTGLQISCILFPKATCDTASFAFQAFVTYNGHCLHLVSTNIASVMHELSLVNMTRLFSDTAYVNAFSHLSNGKLDSTSEKYCCRL